jgi:ParB-like nuclease family protein
MSKLEIHPAAECFRRMDEDELVALAADIEANGQIDPIIVGRINGAQTESLVDGRNRYAACERLGIEPKIEIREFESDDEVRAFVRSRGERRNITKGQMAMGVALLYPEPEKGGRGKKRNVGVSPTFSAKRLSDARKVLANAPELAYAVRDGTRKLDEVLRDIEKQQQALQSDEAKLATLRKAAPDLADLVTDERLALNEAVAALEKRRAEEREQREATLRVMTNAADAVAAFDSSTFCDAVEKIISDPSARVDFAGRLGSELDIDKLERGCAQLVAYLRRIES